MNLEIIWVGTIHVFELLFSLTVNNSTSDVDYWMLCARFWTHRWFIKLHIVGLGMLWLQVNRALTKICCLPEQVKEPVAVLVGCFRKHHLNCWFFSRAEGSLVCTHRMKSEWSDLILSASLECSQLYSGDHSGQGPDRNRAVMQSSYWMVLLDQLTVCPVCPLRVKGPAGAHADLWAVWQGGLCLHLQKVQEVLFYSVC